MPRTGLAIILVLSAGLLAGCPPPQPGGPEVFRPRDDVNRMMMAADPAASDSDGDGLPDSINVSCYLFNAQPGGAVEAVAGNGGFVFEMLDPRVPAEQRQPFWRLPLTYQQARGCLLLDRYGMPTYAIRLPLGRVDSSMRRVILRGPYVPATGPEVAPVVRTVPIPAYPGN